MAEDDLDSSKMPLLEHLIELRRRLIYSILAFLLAFLVCYHFAQDIFGFLTEPLNTVPEGSAVQRLIYTGLTEAFFTYVKVAFWAAAFVSFPVIATQIWMFIAPGLYKNERRAFLPFLIATPVLFFMGGALVYYFIFPLALKFFVSFQTAGGGGDLPIKLEPKVDQYLSLVTTLIFAFGLSFELPVLLTLLARVGIVNSRMLVAKRRYAIVGATIFAAIVTPPDVISQIGLAIPLCLLYEISIWSCRWVERQRAQAAKEAGVE
jgi:sec-independent protein translocase protein TatC